ncbi:MAG TPA: response regulator transcription factor [Roseiflexaceae bacterium]|nr:response regulator transcription factor [Roseiflexaceae bacterium]
MAPRRAQIVVADHQTLFRQSLAYHLKNAGHEVAEAEDGDTLDRAMIEGEPDLLILERYLPGVDSLAYVRMLNALQPQVQILLLVAYEDEARALQSTAFLAGASGCLSKDLTPSAYLTAVRRLLEGGVLFSAEVMRRAARPAAPSGPVARLRELTPRELEILQLLAEGLGNRDIAERLDISTHTAMKHVSNIIGKLKVSNRMEAGLLLIRHGASALLPDTGDEESF